MKNIRETSFDKALSILLCWNVLFMSLPVHAASTVESAAGSEQWMFDYSSQSPQTVTTNLEYDGNGNVVARVDGNGNRTEYEYDKINRLKSIDYPGGDGPEVRFTYDGNGNLTSMTDWTGTTSYAYDDLDRVTAVDYPDGNVIMYGYDLVGNIAWVACGTRSEEGVVCEYAPIDEIGLCAYHLIHYEYDPDNRISSVTDSLIGETTSYAYDEAGNLARCDLPNGCYTTYDYDADGRLIEVENRNAGNGLILKYEYTLNSIGSRTKVVETTSTDTKTTTYAYDALDRLDTVSYPDGRTVDYDYGSFGNRTRLKDFRGSTMTIAEYFYDSDSRLLYTKVNGIENEHFFYDTIGNLIKRVNPDNSKQIEYTYDHGNRLIRYKDGTNDVTYIYDGLGNRVAKTVNGQRIGFLNDVNRRHVEAVAEMDASGEPTRMRIWGNDLVSVRGHYVGSLHYYLHDAPAGSVSHVLNPTRQTVNSYEYDAFGTPTNETESIDNSYQFHGEAQEEETGLIFLRARYYDPSTGRFLSRDPMAGNLVRPETFNPYSFVLNDPINYIDPSGLYPNEPFAFNPFPEKQPKTIETEQIYNRRVGTPEYNPRIDTSFSIPVGPFGLGFSEDGLSLSLGPVSISTYGPILDRPDKGPIEEGIKLGFSSSRLKLQYGEWPILVQNRRLQTSKEYKKAVRDFLSRDDDDSKGGTGGPPNDGGGGDGGPTITRADTYDGIVLPSGVSGSSARPGGVDLNQTAEVFTEIDDIKGVTYDPATGQLVIYGQEDASLPEMNFDDFVVAARAILQGFDPVVSFDPPEVSCIDEQGNERQCHTVRYGPYVLAESTGDIVVLDLSSGTHLGWVMYEADRLSKCLALGKDNVTLEDITCSVPGYKSLVQRRREAAVFTEGESSIRFWFQPETIKVVPSPDGKSMMFAEAGIELLTETKYLSGGQDSGDPDAEAFAAHFNEHFDEFAAEFPVFEDLRQLAKIVGIVKWIVENNIPIDLSIVDNYTIAVWDTPMVTPVTSVTETWTEHFPDHTYTRTLTLTGGVSFEHEIEVAPPSPGFEDVVLAGRLDETDISWTVQTTETEYKAVAVSLEGQPMDGSFTWSNTDLLAKVNGTVPLALTRHYDSFDIEQGPFGWGWSAMPYRLQYKGAKGGFQYNTSAQEGYNRISFVDRNTRSVFDYEPAHFYDRQADPYGIASEFDSQDDILVYSHESKHLPGVLFSDGLDRFIMRMANGMLLSFDADGKLVDIKDRNGNQIVYGYDQSGNLVSISQPASGRAISLSYDGKGRIVTATGPGAKTVSYSYDAAGNLVRVAQDLPEAQVSTGFAAVDLLHVHQETPGGESTEYRYDDQHRLTEILNSDGQPLFALEYDVYGRIVSQTGPAATIGFAADYSLAEGKTQTVGPEDFFQLREYDDNYDLIRWTDARGNIAHFAYNSHQNLTSIVDAEGNTTKFYYRQDGYPVAVTWPNGNSDFVKLNDSGYAIEFLQIPPDTDFEHNFDEDHLLADEWQVNYINKVQYEWDDAGNLKKITDAQLNEYGFEYDSYGNLSRFVDARGFGTSYEYDGLSRLTKVSNEMGHTVSFDHDDRDNLTVVATEAGNVELTYDAQDRLHSIIYGGLLEPHSYKYEYNANGQLCEVTNPDGTVSSYIYDARGNLLQVIHDDVVRFEYEYDDLNRVRQIRYDVGTGAVN